MDQTSQISCLVLKLKEAIVASGLASEEDQLNIELIPDCETDLKSLVTNHEYLLVTINYINLNNGGPVLPDCYYESFSGEPITTFTGEVIECL